MPTGKRNKVGRSMPEKKPQAKYNKVGYSRSVSVAWPVCYPSLFVCFGKETPNPKCATINRMLNDLLLLIHLIQF